MGIPFSLVVRYGIFNTPFQYLYVGCCGRINAAAAAGANCEGLMPGWDSSWRSGVRLTDARRASSTILEFRIYVFFSAACRASSTILGVKISGRLQCGGLRIDAWSISQLCWWDRGTRKNGIGIGPCGIVASGISCPWLWCVVVVCCCS